MHKLLARQVRRFFGSPEALSPELVPFVAAVEEAYRQSDTDRAMLEHSMEVVSAELGDRFRLREALLASKRAEEELSGALSVLTATLESTADGILVVTASGEIVRMNRKFIDLLGVPEDIAGSRDHDHVLEFALKQMQEPEQFVQRIVQIYGEPEEESFDVLHFKDGRIIERYSLPQRIRGETVGRVWSFRDVTDRRELEHQLRQAQKMESIGRLAGGVAHDFNNLLTVISGRIEFLVGAPNLTREQEEDLQEIHKAEERAADLTRQLLAFSRKQLLHPQVVDLNGALDEVAPMLRRLIGEDIQIDFVRGEMLRRVMADPGQVQQVLMNLSLNARDAMPSGGHLTIRTANESVSPGLDNGDGSSSGGCCVVLEVTDTGCGMDEPTASQIFEPFYTTKADGQGTGLGLATVYGIVKQSGATISVETALGEGTRFRILFPMADVVDATPPKQEEPETKDSGSETILLVEDEKSVLALAQRILELRGYNVLPAHHGGEALRIASAPDQRIDLVVTDVVMPGMNGREFVEALHARSPGIPVLYMSGYTDDDIIRRGLMDSSVAFLQKPFTAKGLASLVRSVLDARGALIGRG
jgi:two-component system cell cycle sensor histidine kinase/response regulator CckA